MKAIQFSTLEQILVIREELLLLSNQETNSEIMCKKNTSKLPEFSFKLQPI